MLRAPLTIPQGLATYSARSEFTTESGAITGDSLTVGGVWTVVTSSDADDFSAAAGVATRTAVSDTAPGRFVTAGSTNYAAIAASIDVTTTDWSVTTDQGVCARVVDISNYAAAYVVGTGTGKNVRLSFAARVGGSYVVAFNANPVTLADGTYYTVRCMINAAGFWVAELSSQGSASPIVRGTGYAVELATGGTLATGRVGILDQRTGASAATRTYDNFAAWVPTDDAVCFASRSAELSTKGNTRLDSGGTAYGPVSAQYGDLPRMPNRSSADTVEFVGKLSRGDMATLPDPGVDDVSVRVYRRASYLLLPS